MLTYFLILFVTLFVPQLALENVKLLLMQDITVIFRRRGGDDLEQSHKQWSRTVQSSPDVIDMSFVPVTDLIKDSARKEYLSRAISLYLECKLSPYSSKSFAA